MWECEAHIAAALEMQSMGLKVNLKHLPNGPKQLRFAKDKSKIGHAHCAGCESPKSQPFTKSADTPTELKFITTYQTWECSLPAAGLPILLTTIGYKYPNVATPAPWPLARTRNT